MLLFAIVYRELSLKSVKVRAMMSSTNLKKIFERWIHHQIQVMVALTQMQSMKGDRLEMPPVDRGKYPLFLRCVSRPHYKPQFRDNSLDGEINDAMDSFGGDDGDPDVSSESELQI